MDNGNFGSTTELSLLRSKLSSLKSRGEMTDALNARGIQDIATGAHLVDIDFSKGGKFMWDDSIQRNIFSVIRLLASFVSFREKDIHYNSFDSPVYNVAPSMCSPLNRRHQCLR